MTTTGWTWAEAYYFLACAVELVEARPLDAARLAELRKALGGGNLSRALRTVAEERARLLTLVPVAVGA